VLWLLARLEVIRDRGEGFRRLPPRKARKPSGRRPEEIFTKLIPLDVLGQIQNCCMTELGDILVELGLSQYLDTFVEHGFDTWETILDITESDLWVSNFPSRIPC
jgi:SAM domain (Sterile alpha motif)